MKLDNGAEPAAVIEHGAQAPLHRRKKYPSLAAFSLSLALAAVAAADAPRLERVEPQRVEPHRPFVLVLTGSGFEAGADALIESGTRDRFIRRQPRSLSDTRCEISFALGYGPEPSERRLYVENPGGERSEMLRLEIAAGAGEAPADGAGREPPDPSTTEPGSAGTDSAPVIAELRPAAARAGEPFLLEIFGSGFVPEAEVRVTVNVNAGSSRLPHYAPQPFAALFVDEELLEVEFDRGFYPIPGARDVAVVNPDGAESAPVVLRIQGETLR